LNKCAIERVASERGGPLNWVASPPDQPTTMRLRRAALAAWRLGEMERWRDGEMGEMGTDGKFPSWLARRTGDDK